MNPAEVDPALVEKAARAAYYADPLYRSVFGKILQPPEVLPWDELSLDDIQAYRSNARHVLAAVLPEYAATVLEEFAVNEFQPTFNVSYTGLDAQERAYRRATRYREEQS